MDSVATTTANITPLHITGRFTANNRSMMGMLRSVLTRFTHSAISGAR